MDETDDALLTSGDLEDFGRFYDRYARTLLGFFQRRTGDPEAAADLTAETFAAALVARSRYRPQEAGAAAWLFTIAHRKLTDYHRRGRAEHRMRARLGMEPVPLGAEDAELIRWLGEEVATQMVDGLPEDQRDAIRAHVLEDEGYAEIASRRQVSEATVRKRVSRGLRVLRDRAGGS
jgi:RNA polymerase sigma factor (sigma-70 family)